MVPFSPAYERWAPVVGRLLFSLQFVIAAVFKVVMFSGEVEQTAAAGVPLPTVAVALALVLETVAAIGLLIGWQVRTIAFVLGPYVLLLALIFYHKLGDPTQFGFFVSHLSMIAGLLYVSVYGAQHAAVRKDPLPQ
jgi:putative oxidoreductase